MVLNHLQEFLSGLYEAPHTYDVYDFLITDNAQAEALSPSGTCDNEERLLLHENEDAVDLSVYVDRKILEVLRDDDPFDELHEGNLTAFSLALEGVSHFNYLCWNAGYDKSVTLLELELQAEVDKFVTAMALLDRQGRRDTADVLHTRLFEQIRFHPDLSEEHLARYHDANHYAAKYCYSLRQNYGESNTDSSMKSELRRFYRLTQNGKLRHIDALR